MDSNNETGTGYSSDTFGTAEGWGQPPPQPSDTSHTPNPAQGQEHIMSSNNIQIKLEPSPPHPQEPSLKTRQNPFFFTDEPDSIMEKILMNNPTNVSNSNVSNSYGRRQRYFVGSTPRKDRRREKPSVLKEGFVKFVAAGEKTGEPEIEIISTTQGIANPSSFKGIISLPAASTKKKRPFPILGGDNIDGSIKRLKITPGKTAVSHLNEMSANLEYTYEDAKEHPKSNPMFLCKVTFPLGDNEKECVGQGRSKKIAKNRAATEVLKSLGIELEISSSNSVNTETIMKMEIDPNTTEGQPPPSPFMIYNNAPMEFQPAIDFSSDDPEPMVPVPIPSMIDITALKRLENIPNFATNSLCALNTLVGPDLMEFEQVSEEGPPHDKKFSLVLHLTNGQSFLGNGGSKKRAKSNAAKQALISLLGPSTYQSFSENSLSNVSPNIKKVLDINSMNSRDDDLSSLEVKELFNEDLNTSEYDLTFSDYICRIVIDKYEELMLEHQNYISQKVLAGVVITRQIPMLENGEVIACTTGTKCIEGDFLSTDGLAINDCHAEIMATRCVRDYLYSQIENFIYAEDETERNESILEEVRSDNGEVMYKVKDNVKFHLFISTSPCGDSRIFSPKGLEADDTEDIEDTHPSKRNRGLLRAKVEAGEGTIPVANLITGPQTFDSIVVGGALYTMSCSDKLCRWNAIGIQGGLLSNLMFPTYYSSIILGSLHHPIHFKRAVFGRIESLAGKIPLPFKINRAHLLMVSQDEKRKVKKSPNHAVCWTLGWAGAEILAASKGRCEPGTIPSRLAKRMAFLRFLKLYKNKTGRRDEFIDMSYREAKNIATNYQAAKELFRLHMVETNMGSWISKPLEIDSFHIK